MKLNKNYLLLLLPIIILVALYLNIRRNECLPEDIYKLITPYYIEKVDYFSKYSIIEKIDQRFHTIVPVIDELCITSDGYLIKYKSKNKVRLMYLGINKEPVISDSLDEIKVILNTNEFIWINPRKFVESKTINNPTKLTNQLIVILIVILSFYMIIKVFNLTGIKKSP